MTGVILYFAMTTGGWVYAGTYANGEACRAAVTTLEVPANRFRCVSATTGGRQ
jgi:hypothetical protein